MSSLSDEIKARERKAKKSSLITPILALITIIAIIGFAYLNNDLKETKAKLADKVVELDSTIVELDSTKLFLEKLIAERQKADLDKLKGNSDIWRYTKEENTLEAYLNYLKIEPNTTKIDSVNLALNKLLNKSGYVQIIESNGHELFKDSDLKGYLSPVSARSVRRGVIGNKDFSNTSRNGDVILVGQIVKIEEEFGAGKVAKWAKIKYSKN